MHPDGAGASYDKRRILRLGGDDLAPGQVPLDDRATDRRGQFITGQLFFILFREIRHLLLIEPQRMQLAFGKLKINLRFTQGLPRLEELGFGRNLLLEKPLFTIEVGLRQLQLGLCCEVGGLRLRQLPAVEHRQHVAGLDHVADALGHPLDHTRHTRGDMGHAIRIEDHFPRQAQLLRQRSRPGSAQLDPELLALLLGEFNSAAPVIVVIAMPTFMLSVLARFAFFGGVIVAFVGVLGLFRCMSVTFV